MRDSGLERQAVVRSPMQGAVLGLLVQKPGHGYDLGSRLERRLGPLATMHPKTVYRWLEGLEKADLASANRPAGRRFGDPGRVVYTATERAPQALSAWMAAATKPEPLRSELHAKLIVARSGDIQVLLRELVRFERHCIAMLRESEIETPAYGSLQGIGIFLTREAAVKRLNADLEWADLARSTLEAFAAIL